MTDTTDREMHEYAAKAAGIALVWNGDRAGFAEPNACGMHDGSQWLTEWNPRHDNNDAFQLAARLKIQVAFGTFKDNVASAYRFGAPAVEVENADIEAAAREAIFLMAAEIGKGKND